jgi:hypothetical protein
MLTDGALPRGRAMPFDELVPVKLEPPDWAVSEEPVYEEPVVEEPPSTGFEELPRNPLDVSCPSELEEISPGPLGRADSAQLNREPTMAIPNRMEESFRRFIQVSGKRVSLLMYPQIPFSPAID